jgi:hypothetical protein
MKKNRKTWRIVSAAFVMAFLLILAGGLIKARGTEYSVTAATPEQVEYAKLIVAQELQSKGDSIENYDVMISQRIREFGRQKLSKNIMQASLYKDSARHLFLIDTDSGRIIMHTKTEFYGWMNDSDRIFKRPPQEGINSSEEPRWFHNRLWQQKHAR